MVKSLCMALVYCPGLTCIQEGWQYHSLVDFQLGVKLDSISLPDICTESSECHTSLYNSGSDLIINMHCSGESASQVGELVNNFQFLPIHSDGGFLSDIETDSTYSRKTDGYSQYYINMSGPSGHLLISEKANCQLLDLNYDRKSYFLI